MFAKIKFACLVLTCLLVFVSGCSATTEMYQGMSVSSEQVIVTRERTPSQGMWETFDLTIKYEYLQDGLSLELHLGRVHDVAEIEINGHPLAPLLVYPYSADVTAYARAGRSELKVTITPALRNRLVGYGKAGIKACRHFKGRELSPSGLIGPVEIRAAWSVKLPAESA